MFSSKWRIGLALLVCLMAWPSMARAQSAISGLVRDTSGAVMPGVTVEVSSPALIEKTRSVVTDGEGRYQIVDLRPGVYTITAQLARLQHLAPRGARAAGELHRAGQRSTCESVHSKRASPSLAPPPSSTSQNAVQQMVLSRASCSTPCPPAAAFPTLGALMPGARLAMPDVGGTSGMQNRDLTVHGSDGRDTTFQVDGMTLNGLEGDGSVQSYFNEAMFEEVSYQTSAINAEVSAGGVRANMIPKDGGNQFKGTLFFSGANENLQSDNSDDADAPRG